MTATNAGRRMQIKSSLTTQTERLNKVASIFQTYTGAEMIEASEFKKIGPATRILKQAEKEYQTISYRLRQTVSTADEKHIEILKHQTF